MRIVKSTNNLKSDFRKVIQEYKNLMAYGEHLGRAITVPVTSLSLLDWVGSIFQQCVNKLGKVRIGK